MLARTEKRRKLWSWFSKLGATILQSFPSLSIHLGSTFPSPEPRWLGGWRCLGTLPFDPGIWTGHTCTPPHCHHAGLPASEFCMIWQTLFSKYNAVSTSETSSDLCHCLKHSLAPRPSHPRLQNAVHGLFLDASPAFWKALSHPVPSRASLHCSVSSICWQAGVGPPP